MSGKEEKVNFADACYDGSLEYIQKLIDQGADINQTGYQGRNGLMLAVQGSKVEIIKLLHGKNDQQIHAKDESGESAITLAGKNADLEIVKLLKSLGAKMNFANACRYTVRYQIVDAN